jgi:hypothetical protein
MLKANNAMKHFYFFNEKKRKYDRLNVNIRHILFVIFLDWKMYSDQNLFYENTQSHVIHSSYLINNVTYSFMYIQFTRTWCNDC